MFVHVNTFPGGIIALWKSVLITVKVEIGGATPQIELRVVKFYGGGNERWDGG